MCTLGLFFLPSLFFFSYPSFQLAAWNMANTILCHKHEAHTLMIEEEQDRRSGIPVASVEQSNYAKSFMNFHMRERESYSRLM